MRGSSAEQPRPARPNAAAPSPGVEDGANAVATKASAITQGSRRKVLGPDSQRSIEAKSTRPAVAAAQNSVSVTAASPAGALQHALHVEDRPVAVERLDDPVAERERREEPELARETRRDRSALRPRRRRDRLDACRRRGGATGSRR